VLSSAVYRPNRRRVNEEDYCGYTKPGMTMKSVSVL